jgi:hypothetical protein
MEAVANISAGQAASKPVKNAHSIWEIALHINAWQFCAQICKFVPYNICNCASVTPSAA